MGIAAVLASKNPELKKKLKMARLDVSPEDFAKQSITMAFGMSFSLTVILFFLFDKSGGPVVLLPFVFFILLTVFYRFNMLKVNARINKRKKDIDKDVLFAGRFLLVKLNSGEPLMNALIDAASSYGVANEHFKEIVKDIELGKPIERALTDASEYSPSAKFRKILFQIGNALKIGIDVTEFLDATLNEIADEQLIEITRYGKKLSSITLFYMLFAVVLPSLGLTIFIVIASMASIQVDMTFFGVILFFLAIIQAMFLIVYRSSRPNINL